ncbi:hypothetical protein [Nocardia sp. NPDC003726]
MKKIAAIASISVALLAAGAPAIAAAQPEPHVVECLEGTPGPARWSDGSVRYSQWCFDTHGGKEYLEEESKSGGQPSPRGYTCYHDSCYWPDGSPVPGYQRCGLACGEPPTSGDIQSAWAECIAVKTEAECREEQHPR